MKEKIANFYNKYIKRLLKFFRIIDEQGDLSITNLLIMLFVYKFAQTPMDSFSIESVGPMIGAMGLYFGKKVVNKPGKTPVITEEMSDEIMDKIKEFAKMDEEDKKD